MYDMSADSITREQWLAEVLKWTAKDVFGCNQAPTQPDHIRASVGWPSSGGLGKKKRTIGQCWSVDSSAGRVNEIFISPWLSDPIEVCATLIHEVVHAAVGVDAKHLRPFAEGARAVGLLKPWTATTASEELRNKITHFLEEVAPYPHHKLDPKSLKGPTKPQTNKHLKLQCPNCAYVVRSTQKFIDLGLPTCHCGGLFELVDKPKETEDE